MSDGDTPKLHIDSDWKAEAQREKERLAAQEEASRESRGPAAGGELPEASFRGLMTVLASQALVGLGTMVDPESRGVIVDLEGSRLAIDLLGVIEEKTKGNLTDEEKTELTQILASLRGRYVQVAQMVAEQSQAGNAVAIDPSTMAGPNASPPTP